ncbi:MAG: DUF2007 domain-containing protein, partial [Candidatus Omnitrophota bacterium]
MIRVYSPRDEVELALIRSLLKSEGIQYFVHNDNFGSLNIGPKIELYNTKAVMVDEKDAERARELISDYLRTTKEGAAPEQKYSLGDRIRMTLEFI